jgi:glycine oxidase
MTAAAAGGVAPAMAELWDGRAERTTADVAVVGGGVVGLAVAWRAARAGLSVVVCDPAPGEGASWAAAGMLAPATEARWGEEALHRLAQASAAQWPSFAAELESDSGTSVGLRTEGALSVALDADDYRALADAVDVQRQLGCQAQLLTGRECRALEPALSPRVTGGALYPADHQVDNRAVVVALARAAARRGAELRRAAVEEVLRQPGGGRATGVRLAGGTELAAGAVVLAAGCASGAVGGLSHSEAPPVRPVKGQILRLWPVPPGDGTPLLGRTVRASAEGRSVYLVPRASGEVVVGATMEEKGFDVTVTAGAVWELLRAAVAVVPDVTELELREALARLRPGTPDNGPLLGPSGTEGLWVATGHFRHGILLTPITASALAGALAGRPLGDEVAPFAPGRFAEREAANA